MNNRLQKKCVVGSALMHGLLVCILIFGAAFAKPNKPANTLPPVTLVSLAGIITDGPSRGGGEPKTPTPQPAPAPQPPPQPAPQPAPPPTTEPVKIPDPPKVKVKPAPAPKVEKVIEKPDIPMVKNNDNDIMIKDPPVTKTKPKREVKVDLDNVVDTGAKRRREEAKKRAEEDAREAAEQKAYDDRMASSLSSLRSSIHSTAANAGNNVANSGEKATAIDMGGLGSGPAFANYRDAVYSAYFHAWMAPEDVISSETTVEAKIVVARDGTVIGAHITKRSKNAGLDHSVERALKKVDHLPAFPKDTSDSERSFLIIFDLEAKRSIG